MSFFVDYGEWQRMDVLPVHIPDPAVVLLLDGTYGLKFFDGRPMARGFTCSEAYAARASMVPWPLVAT